MTTTSTITAVKAPLLLFPIAAAAAGTGLHDRD